MVERIRKNCEAEQGCFGKVLLVQKNFALRQMMADLLATCPEIRLQIVQNGDEALEAKESAWANNEPFACILVDDDCSGCFGLEAVETIRNMGAEKLQGSITPYGNRVLHYIQSGQ